MVALKNGGLNKGMNEKQKSDPILVIGATGTTGRRIVQQLKAAGWPVRSASRSSEWHFDWQDPATWDRALTGASAAYVVQLDSDMRTRALIARAEALGVQRLVLLSGRGIDNPDYYDDPTLTADDFLDSEEALRNSGLEWTIVRPGWFSQNFSESIFRDGVLAGELRLPVGEGAVTFVDAEDIAAVAVAALTEDGHHGHTYELSGPRALTFAEATAEISQATNQLVRYVPVTKEEFVDELISHGMPEGEARVYATLHSPIRTGKDHHQSDGVQRALGREPRDFTTFVADAVAAGAWERTE